METLQYKSWISTLGLHRDMQVQSGEGAVVVRFKLIYYKVEDGVMRLELMLNDTAWAQMGMGEFKLCPEVTVRAHSPIELHSIGGCGYSPKMVYRLPKGYTVRRVAEKVVKSLYDRARTHNFEASTNV
jgi:hypothetical protein